MSDLGASACYGLGWRQLWKNFLMLFLIGIVALLIDSPGTVLSQIAQRNSGGGGAWLLSTAYGILVTAPIAYGAAYVYLRAVRDEDLQVRDLFEAFYNYWNAVGASLLVTFIIGFGMLLLIVPGIIFACKLSFTPYLVVDRQLGAIDAIKESWRMTTGHSWTVFFIVLLGIPLVIGGLLCLVVGVIVAIMWITLAMAALYHGVSSADDAFAAEAHFAT